MRVYVDPPSSTFGATKVRTFVLRRSHAPQNGVSSNPQSLPTIVFPEAIHRTTTAPSVADNSEWRFPSHNLVLYFCSDRPSVPTLTHS